MPSAEDGPDATGGDRADTPGDGQRAAPEFGPPGYLPDRAARRARKIILREPLGLQWAIAAIVTGLVVVVAGAAFLLGLPGGPTPDEEPVAGLAELERGQVLRTDAADDEVLVLRAGGGLHAFAAPTTRVVWCEPSGRLEGEDGRVWGLDGAREGGSGSSLAVLPVSVHDERVHVAPEAATAPEPTGEQRAPVCLD